MRTGVAVLNMDAGFLASIWLTVITFDSGSRMISQWWEKVLFPIKVLPSGLCFVYYAAAACIGYLIWFVVIGSSQCHHVGINWVIDSEVCRWNDNSRHRAIGCIILCLIWKHHLKVHRHIGLPVAEGPRFESSLHQSHLFSAIQKAWVWSRVLKIFFSCKSYQCKIIHLNKVTGVLQLKRSLLGSLRLFWSKLLRNNSYFLNEHITRIVSQRGPVF